jgi:UDP:flavonoid glycosyltransferase YjiC (YdhE family)
VTSPRLARKKKFLQDNGIAGSKSVVDLYQKDVPWLSQTLAEAEYPLPVIPPNVTACGPILFSSAPAAQQDPELAKWLERAPTVLINLGTLLKYDERGATEMVQAIKIALNRTDAQFLWKFRKRHDFSDEFLSSISAEIAEGRVKVLEWLDLDPPALLQTGHIAASVHHGGANSFAEAIAYVLSFSWLLY